jgi:catechol 2,3-dioxygenase-like lactoylglutathione lyase family enzyme
MTITAHHVGICVTDLERSLRFWCDGLGFETTMVPPVGNEWSDALEIGGDVAFTAHFIAKDGFEFELLHYDHPEPHGKPSAQRNQLGFTHFAVNVDDVDAVADRLVQLGGTVLESTRTKFTSEAGTTELMFVADPDGVRVELVSQR